MIPIFLITVSSVFHTASEANALALIFNARDEAAMILLLERAENLHDSPLKLGLIGYAEAVLADSEWSPWAKLNRFNTGKSLLESAISKSPGDSVIRCLRLMIQAEAPGFLDYRSDIDADVLLICRHLTSGHSDWSRTLRNGLQAFATGCKGLSGSHRIQIQTALAK